MRKVTLETVTAFVNGYDKKLNNTEVATTDRSVAMYLHGNLIARLDVPTNTLTIKDSGWESVTTKERLNGLLSRLAPDYGIVQNNHEWYITKGDGELLGWTGEAEFRAGHLMVV